MVSRVVTIAGLSEVELEFEGLSCWEARVTSDEVEGGPDLAGWEARASEFELSACDGPSSKSTNPVSTMCGVLD